MNDNIKAIIDVHNQIKEIKSNRVWREECESLRQQVADLESFDGWKAHPYTKVLEESIANDYVPKSALKQQGEPLAWLYKDYGRWLVCQMLPLPKDAIPVYTSAPTIPEEWEFAGWQQRYIDPEEGPSLWQPCSERDAEIIGGRKDYELRKVYAAPKPEE